MLIGEFARSVGVSERALRYYEEHGLVRPGRTGSGYRDYTDADAQTVRHIRCLLAAGLQVDMIAEVLPCLVDTGSGLAPACPELLPLLHHERDRIASAIAELDAARTALDTIIAANPASGT